jgi:hypothetical protein
MVEAIAGKAGADKQLEHIVMLVGQLQLRGRDTQELASLSWQDRVFRYMGKVWRVFNSIRCTEHMHICRHRLPYAIKHFAEISILYVEFARWLARAESFRKSLGCVQQLVLNPQKSRCIFQFIRRGNRRKTCKDKDFSNRGRPNSIQVEYD